jgi:hypothetical protein
MVVAMTDQNSNPFGTGAIRRQVAAPEGSRAGLLVVPGTIPAEELQLHDQMYIQAKRDLPGSGEVLFEGSDDEPGDQDREWYTRPLSYGRSVAGSKSQAEHWAEIMSWPKSVLPTFAEAMQWSVSADCEAYNALVDRVMVFRERFAECERLAKLGGVLYWRGKMGLQSHDPDVSENDVAQWLAADVADITLAAWRKELEARKATQP